MDQLSIAVIRQAFDDFIDDYYQIGDRRETWNAFFDKLKLRMRAEALRQDEWRKSQHDSNSNSNADGTGSTQSANLRDRGTR